MQTPRLQTLTFLNMQKLSMEYGKGKRQTATSLLYG